MRELSEGLKGRALQAGADLAGIAPARPLPEANAYRDWLAAGMQATMDYMARSPESREDITRWYPQAKSVLICGFSYSDNSPRAAARGEGRIARYAVLNDYHPELKRRMGSILSWLKERAAGAEGRVFVDTSPLLERLYARYAGVGFIGKNTMLISAKKGSYLLLAGLALNLDLTPDEPVADHCGTCNRCLEACPTQAFPKERVLDAGRCVSYFTIEHRGAIPKEFRPGVGNWVMGCDICQEVCPWNRFATAGSVFEPAVAPSLPLEELASLDNRMFKEKFGATPIERARRRGVVRSSLLAMGNSRDERFRPALERFSRDPDPLLSEQAAWSLARLEPGDKEC